MTKAKTLFDKIWDSHVIMEKDGESLIYIDRHIIHEVTSPQAFEGLRVAGLKPRQIGRILAVADHNTPTKDIDSPIKDEASKLQLEALSANAKEFGIEYHPLGSKHNGVCHVMAPDLAFTLPGCTVVCGDSHTATHGAFGAMAFGMGTSEVEHVLATQTLRQQKVKNMRITVNGQLNKGVTPKDVILYIIGKIGTAGGTGYAIEFAGDVFEQMSMEGRMTVCNMTIEAGARVGMVAPDETTFAYLKGKEKAPKGDMWDRAVEYWKSLKTDADAVFDKEHHYDAKDIMPQVSWGTSPEDVVAVNGKVPAIKGKERALEYMGLQAGMNMEDISIDRVFIGSCTNGRLEDLEAAAAVVNGRKVADHVTAIVVPGSGEVKRIAEERGLDKIFMDAGFEWRNPGCSMCLAMNDDKAQSGERVASTSNRNFEGRQGRGARTHLMSPAMAANTAIHGHIAAIKE